MDGVEYRIRDADHGKRGSEPWALTEGFHQESGNIIAITVLTTGNNIFIAYVFELSIYSVLVCTNFKGTECDLNGEFQHSQEYKIKWSQKKKKQQETKDKIMQHCADAFDMDDCGRKKSKTIPEIATANIYGSRCSV